LAVETRAYPRSIARRIESRLRGSVSRQAFRPGLRRRNTPGRAIHRSTEPSLSHFLGTATTDPQAALQAVTFTDAWRSFFSATWSTLAGVGHLRVPRSSAADGHQRRGDPRCPGAGTRARPSTSTLAGPPRTARLGHQAQRQATTQHQPPGPAHPRFRHSRRRPYLDLSTPLHAAPHPRFVIRQPPQDARHATAEGGSTQTGTHVPPGGLRSYRGLGVDPPTRHDPGTGSGDHSGP